MLQHVRQAVSSGGVKPALPSPFQRSSYPQLRLNARYVPLRDELVNLFGFSESTGRNDAGSLNDDEHLQIARQISDSAAASAYAFSINRSRSPSPLRAPFVRQAPHTFFSELSGSQPAARTQFGQQTSGNTYADSALLVMRAPSPTSAASAVLQTITISEKAALELLEATSEQQLRRDESEESERLGRALAQDTFDLDVSSATPRRSTHTRLYPILSDM